MNEDVEKALDDLERVRAFLDGMMVFADEDQRENIERYNRALMDAGTTIYGEMK